MTSDAKTAALSLKKLLFLLSALLLLIGVGSTAPIDAAPVVQEPTAEPTPTAAIAPESVETHPGIPVTVGGETLFYIGSGIGDQSATERAAAISSRLEDLSSNPFLPPYDIAVAKSGDETSIFFGDQLILTVTEADARANGMTSDDAGEAIGERINTTITHMRTQQTIQQRGSAMLTGLLVAGILVLLIWLINWVFNRVIQWIDVGSTKTKQFHRLTSSNFYRSGRWKPLTKAVAGAIRWGLIIITLLIGIPLVLRGFPTTRKAAEEVLTLILTPFALFWTWLVDYQDQFLIIVMIVLGAFLLLRLVHWFFGEVARGGLRFKGTDPMRARFTSGLLSALIILAAAVMIFPYLPGSDSPAFHAMVIFIGALITFSSTSAIANTVSGILLVYTDAFTLDEIVQIGQVQGRVVGQHLLTTELRTFRNETVTIPNSVVMNSYITNFSRLAIENGLIMHTTVTIGYDVPWKQVHNLLVAAALETPDILDKPTPFVLQLGLNDFSVAYDLNCLTKHPEKMLIVYSNLHQKIQDQFNAAGIEILSPVYTALRDGNTVAIPEADRAEGDNPPGFRRKK